MQVNAFGVPSPEKISFSILIGSGGDARKRKIMTLLLVTVGILAYAGSCAGWFVTNLACNPQDAVNFLYSLFVAGAANQGFHALTKPAAPNEKLRPKG